MPKKILLLTPPSKKILQRDFMCSCSTKADYYWHPIDLVVLSGVLREHEVKLIDFMTESRNEQDVLELIKHERFDYILSLVSAVDFENEAKFFEKIKESSLNVKIVVFGDIAFFDKEQVLKKKSIDAVLLNFSSHEILKYMENPDSKKIKDMAYKIGKKIVFNEMQKVREFSYGKANLKIFDMKKYSLPYSKYHPVAPILMNYGCPYRCSFCNSGRIGYSLRKFSEIENEIKDFAEQGFKEIFIRDFNFTTNKEFVKRFCSFMINNNIKLAWSCEARVDNVDPELLELMKKAGCYLIFFGVEVGDQKRLDKFNKMIKIEQIKDVFKACRKIGIRTIAYVILAMPGDTKEDMLETIKITKEIDTDYASFNLYVPRYGSLLREQLQKDSKIPLDKLDSTIEFINLTNVSDEEIIKLHKYAMRSFYFRPSYLFRKLTEIRTWHQFKLHLTNAMAVLKNVVS